MENASDALMMAFGVIIFVLALTVAINAFSQARQTSEMVIYSSDETNFYEYEELTGGASQNRIVGVETVIPTLYRYYKENYSVLFRKGTGYEMSTGHFDNLTIYELYKSPEVYQNKNQHNMRISEDKYFDKISSKYQRFYDQEILSASIRRIFSFDLEEEQIRNEPWTISNDEIKRNLDCFIYGETYTLPSDGSQYIKYKGFLKEHAKDRFVENIAEIDYNAVEVGEETKDEIEVSTTRTKKKRIYIFTLIESIKESINNEEE